MQGLYQKSASNVEPTFGISLEVTNWSVVVNRAQSGAATQRTMASASKTHSVEVHSLRGNREIHLCDKLESASGMRR